MAIIELKDGRKVEIRGDATPEKIKALLATLQAEGRQAAGPEVPLIAKGSKAYESLPTKGRSALMTALDLPGEFVEQGGEAVKGALKGIGSTMAGASAIGEDIISVPQRIFGVKQQPTLGREMIESGFLTPAGTAQKLGYGVEKAAEMLAPVPGVGKLKAVTTAGKIGRTALEGLVGGAAGGATMAASRGATLGETAKETVGGAVIGAAIAPPLMGAISLGAGTYRALKQVIGPEAVESFVRGIAPTGAKASVFKDAAKTAMPDLMHASSQLERSGGKGYSLAESDKPFDALAAAAKEAKKGIWRQYETIMGNYGNFRIDGNSVADGIVGSMDRRFRTQNPAAAAAIEAKANQYRRGMTLDEAEEWLESANSELHSYYAKNKVGQAAAMGDPEIAHVVNEAKGLRDALYGKLDEAAGLGKDARALKGRYGALTDVQSQALRRKSVVDRLKPMDLQETIHGPLAVAKVVGSAARGDVIGAGEGLAQYALSRSIKKAMTNEEMVRKAFRAAKRKGMKPYAELEMPQPIGTERQLGGPTSIPLGAKAAAADTSGIVKAATPVKMTPTEAEARVKAIAATTGRRPTAGDFTLETEGVRIEQRGERFYVTREGYAPVRISGQEANTLEDAGYEIVRPGAKLP